MWGELMSGDGKAAGVGSLEDRLGYGFADPALLEAALTHPSLGGGRRTQKRSTGPAGRPGFAYERLEFLGDRVLGLIVAERLMARFPDEPEGGLTRRHAALVQAEALARVARGMDLGPALKLSAGESGGGGRDNPALLADACEAVIGAVYLDGGLEAARRVVDAHWQALMEAPPTPPVDPKTALQEWLQARGLARPVYEIRREEGPAHAPHFEVAARLADGRSATGTGTSKRAAEKQAARALLARLEEEAR